MPESHRVVPKWTQAKNCQSRRSRLKDQCWTQADQEAMMHRTERDEL